MVLASTERISSLYDDFEPAEAAAEMRQRLSEAEDEDEVGRTRETMKERLVALVNEAAKKGVI